MFVVNAIVFKEAVSHHPFNCSERGKHLAVVESSSALNKVVSWGLHHRGSDHHLSSISRLSVVHEGPDPEGSLIERAKIITCHKFDSEGVIICFSFDTELIIGPLNAEIVDFRTSVANLIFFVEICEFSAAMLLNLLS